MEQQRIVCAAIKNRRGLIICSARHYDELMISQIEKSTSAWLPNLITQGFIDNKGCFLTREEAFTIAKIAGQIIERCGGDKSRLFSENLY